MLWRQFDVSAAPTAFFSWTPGEGGKIMASKYFAMPDLMLHEFIHILQWMSGHDDNDLLDETESALLRSGNEGKLALAQLREWYRRISKSQLYSKGNLYDEFAAYLYQQLVDQENPVDTLEMPPAIQAYYDKLGRYSLAEESHYEQMQDFITTVKQMLPSSLKQNLRQIWRRWKAWPHRNRMTSPNWRNATTRC